MLVMHAGFKILLRAGSPSAQEKTVTTPTGSVRGFGGKKEEPKLALVEKAAAGKNIKHSLLRDHMQKRSSRSARR